MERSSKSMMIGFGEKDPGATLYARIMMFPFLKRSFSDNLLK